ncbi:MAG: hypothetical protein P4L55_12100, partial [Syntrophobacteraceae bacterium]|nr:hypothetical protein [Syntrophobacteraceae bacterium]
MRCEICERKCDIEQKGIGGCGMYIVMGGQIRERYPDRYLAAIGTAIESMPMVHYHPGGKFLQVCTAGCNFSCRGCVSEVLTGHFRALEGVSYLTEPALEGLLPLLDFVNVGLKGHSEQAYRPCGVPNAAP